MSEDQLRNPCSFKQQCKACVMVEKSDRPVMCAELQCEWYKPCNKCKNNRRLDDKGVCAQCGGGVGNQVRNEKRQRKQEGEATIPDETGQERKLSLSLPGTPPKELKPDEKAFYEHRWGEYAGYYRDPASTNTCHQMILEEIRLHHLNSRVMLTRGAAEKTLLSQKEASIRMLTDLKKALPEKEASEMSEAEKSFGKIYDDFVTEQGLRSLGRSGRILTVEAMALAEVVPFKLDPVELLTDLGFTVATAREAAAQFVTEMGTGAEAAMAVLEFYGFKLNERYALPYDPALAGDDDSPDDAGTNEVLDLNIQEETDVELDDAEGVG